MAHVTAQNNHTDTGQRDRCLKVAEQLLSGGKSVAVGAYLSEAVLHLLTCVLDNTNADGDVRKKWIDVAAKHSVPIRCVHFTTAEPVCLHNDVVRGLNGQMNPEKRTLLPSVAFRGFASRYQAPKLSEGFQDISVIPFQVSPIIND